MSFPRECLMKKKLLSERHGLTQARVKEELDATTSLALIGLVNAKIDEHWFGQSFPFECQDGRANAGYNRDKLVAAMDGYNLIWPGSRWKPTAENFPANYQVFDLIEFSYEYVAL